MRTLLRGSLGKSLRAMGDEDRLAAAWTVVCGRALGERGAIAGYADGVVQVEVVDALWLGQMTGMRAQLIREMATIANVPVREMRFTVRGRAAGERRDMSEGRCAVSEMQGVVKRGATAGGVTVEDVRYVAQLANLELTAEEEPRMQRDLNAILGHIAQLNEVDTEGVPAMAQVSELLSGVLDGEGEGLREDQVRPSLDRASGDGGGARDGWAVLQGAEGD